jgi:acetyl-CoA acetyltransferase
MDFVKHLMSVAVENVARRYEISRTRDGEFAVASKQKAEAVAPGLR